MRLRACNGGQGMNTITINGRTFTEREFSRNQKVVRHNDNNLFKEIFLVTGYVPGHDLCELKPLNGGKLQVEYPDKLEAI